VKIKFLYSIKKRDIYTERQTASIKTAFYKKKNKENYFLKFFAQN